MSTLYCFRLKELKLREVRPSGRFFLVAEANWAAPPFFVLSGTKYIKSSFTLTALSFNILSGFSNYYSCCSYDCLLLLILFSLAMTSFFGASSFTSMFWILVWTLDKLSIEFLEFFSWWWWWCLGKLNSRVLLS